MYNLLDSNLLTCLFATFFRCAVGDDSTIIFAALTVVLPTQPLHPSFMKESPSFSSVGSLEEEFFWNKRANTRLNSVEASQHSEATLRLIDEVVHPPNGLTEDRNSWIPSRAQILLPCRNLTVFRPVPTHGLTGKRTCSKHKELSLFNILQLWTFI